jgi:hypothetical protein
LSTFVEALRGVLIVLFFAGIIFASILNTRMMRKLLERSSIFSPNLIFRAMGTREFYLLVVLVCVLTLLGLMIKVLTELGL